tara:strand:+ start:28 stop:474 length:447 start_codon:yes stop_codon:yes gene_type:complete
MNKFVLEDLEDAIKKLKKMGKAVDADTVTRKDLYDLTKAKGSWELTPAEMEKVTQQTPNIHNDTTKPGVKHDTKPDGDAATLDLVGDTDFTDTGFDSAKTHLDDFSSTDVVSRVADALAAKLSSSEYRAMSSDDLKAALEVELKNYLK